MNYFEIASILVSLSAVFGYINEKYLKLPTTIGLMLIAIIFTLITIVSSYINPILFDHQRQLISNIDFSVVLLDMMLSFMLFAGAMHTNFEQLKIQRRPPCFGFCVYQHFDIDFFGWCIDLFGFISLGASRAFYLHFVVWCFGIAY